MAKFCIHCGKKLQEGEICHCKDVVKEKPVNNTVKQEPPKQDPPKQDPPKKDFFEKLPERDTITISTEDWVPIRKLLGIGEDNNYDTVGCFERDKLVVPDLVAPCEQEVSVKQYHICNARSKLRGLWQEGKIQVTNKRVIFRLSGRSWIGKAMDHIEFTIDEVAGVSISNGVRFSLFDIVVGLIICMMAMMVGIGIGNMPALLSYVVGLAAIAPFFMFKKKYFIKAVSLAAGMGAIITSSARIAWEHEFWAKVGLFFVFIMAILFIVVLFLYSLKPSLSISVMTKCASAEPIYIWSKQNLVSIMEILPGADADVAIEELGSLIMDIQKLGDYGIEKWQEN